MQTAHSAAAHPFALMMDPQSVLAAVEGSAKLGGLNRRICRPLDRPMIPKRRAPDLLEFDRQIDEAGDLDLPAEHDRSSE